MPPRKSKAIEFTEEISYNVSYMQGINWVVAATGLQSMQHAEAYMAKLARDKWIPSSSFSPLMSITRTKTITEPVKTLKIKYAFEEVGTDAPSGA